MNIITHNIYDLNCQVQIEAIRVKIKQMPILEIKEIYGK